MEAYHAWYARKGDENLMADYKESDDRYRTSHRVVREQRAEQYKQREKNIAQAHGLLRTGKQSKHTRDLIGDPFADKE